MTYHHIRVEPLSRAIGAEISGVDLSASIHDEAFAEIGRAFGEYGVVFFRNQRLTPDQHVGFAERFGPININRFFATVPGYPMIAEVRVIPGVWGHFAGGGANPVDTAFIDGAVRELLATEV